MMTDWHVRVDYPCPAIVDQDEAAERLALRLAAAGNAVVAIDRRRGRAVIRLSVEAGSVRQAVDQGVREAERIATAAELTRRAVRAEAITAEEAEDELADLARTGRHA